MRKKVVLISLPILLIAFITFNYTYRFSLNHKIPIENINQLSITGGSEGTNLNIKDIQDIKEIYNYIFNRKCKKVNKLFYNNTVPVDNDYMPYLIIFYDTKHNHYYSSILFNDKYLEIGNTQYFLEDSNFDYKHFESLLK